MESRKEQFLLYAKNMLWLMPLVSAGYLYTNWRADQIARSFEIYADFELKMPFISWAQYFYIMIVLYLVLPPLVLKKSSLVVLHKQLFIGSLISFAFFYIFPSSLAYVRLEPKSGLLSLIYSLDRPNNASFSLYHLFLGIITLKLSQTLKGVQTLIFVMFSLLVACSGPLIWQQHLIGIVLAWVVAVILFVFIRESGDQV